jgi:hypothetical protein
LNETALFHHAPLAADGFAVHICVGSRRSRCDSANFIKQQGRCLYFICRKGLQPLHSPKLV